MSRPSAVAALISLALMELARSGIWLAFIPLAAGGSVARADTLGLALSIHYGTETVLKLAAGWAVDLLGARRILPLSLLLATGAAALLVLSPASPFTLLVGAMLLGLCTAPAWLAVIQAVAPPAEASGSKMGAIWMAWLAGMGGGPVLTGIALEYLPGGGVAIALVAVLALAFLSVLLFPVPARRGAPANLDRPLHALKAQWRELAPLAPALVGQTLLAGMLAPVLPRVAQDMAGLSPAQYSLMLTVAGVACLAGMLPGGWLVDRLGGRSVLVGGFLGMGSLLAAAAGLLSLAEPAAPGAGNASIAGPLLLAAACGLAYALVLPAWTSTIGKAVPADAIGTGWGLISTLEGAGLALGPAIGGALWSSAPTSLVVAAAITLGLLGLYYQTAPLPGQAAPRNSEEGGSSCPNG